MPFAPDQTEDLIYKIAALHKQHKGQTPAQAALHYLEYSHKMDLYGLDLHQVKDAENKDILLGIGAAGISTYRENILINKFNWPKILKISYRRNKFLLRVKPAESSSFESWVTFKLPDNKAAKALWKITVEHHVFIRLRSADQAKKRFSRSGSKFRFTGRTLHQARTNAAAPQESNKAKTRHSLGSLFHRSKTMNYSLLPS
ncbi:protein 4.1-like [Physella acuta]|uniref:protein 4.1-like n=1 Tax=Physella acuta TaxID=109671 RepID=UPI0027DDF6A9|nr:protein 4.1-like [Physella acuta]